MRAYPPGVPPAVARLPVLPVHAVLAVLAALLGTLLVLTAAPAQAAPIEDYATWEAGDQCRPQDKPGTVFLADWIVRTYGGVRGGIGRSCSSATSEHEEGRAFDWTLDATRKADRVRARAFLAMLRATDRKQNTDARARRMGVMYVIWNDRMWAAWDRFAPKDYLSSGCTKVRTCSTTLRHRDHLHLSLSRAGGRGETSFYTRRMPQD